MTALFKACGLCAGGGSQARGRGHMAEGDRQVGTPEGADLLAGDGQRKGAPGGAFPESHAVADDDGQSDTPEQPAPEEPAPVGTTVVIVSQGGKVNVRCGNGTEYACISAVAPGSTFPHVATAQNGWHALVIGSRVGWVSGNFAKIV